MGKFVLYICFVVAVVSSSACDKSPPTSPSPVIPGFVPETIPPADEIYYSQAGFVMINRVQVPVAERAFSIRPTRLVPGRNSVFDKDWTPIGGEFVFSVDCSVPLLSADSTGYRVEVYFVDENGQRTGLNGMGVPGVTKPCESKSLKAMMAYRAIENPENIASLKVLITVEEGFGLVQIPVLAMVPVGWHH